ncbi:uncharacterized protein LOC132605947 [Lycium barbarum]|uniref:uncharacterized protein LOC132605947 n=1 Tax=Lycium barbarum TaxID=112863 RepID=UPI00293F2952|nr:uncharacterized protein LOC132605947 [Lycium barbarum]XP_060175219.1 uncharacterized protein LOC132605947 [Lycium barbarum]XP_060175225.1 uncharacterized protein LOC132605947 [Lycium barbarum]XP_060175232.1 uncharacterized protein LOC132605947 [Lycium barbarum]
MERQLKQGERKRIENEELVKYMSSLPSFLEKGENLQDKAFSVGVLDWRFLEKWQYEHVNIPCRSSVCSPSSSNTLSVSSMEGSSSNSSRARSCSPSRRKNQQRNLLELSKDQHPRRTSRVRRSLDVETETRTSSSKGNMKIQDRECLSKQEEGFAISCHRVDDFVCIEKHKSVTLQVPEPGQETNSCTTYCPPDSVVRNEGAVKPSRRSFSCGFISAFLPAEAGESKMGQASSVDAKDTSSSSQTIQPSSYSVKRFSSPPRVNYKLEKKSTATLNNPVAPSSSETTKVRNSSPTRRLSMAMGRIGQMSGIKDLMTVSQGVKYPAEQSGSNKAQTSSSLDTGCDKADPTNRARTSPLRRLLDPLLKPKTGNSDNVKRGEPPTKRSLKVKLDLKGCRDVDINDPCSKGTNVPSKLQALLQVAVKNGLPLFTFAVDNEVDILAATMKRFSSTLKENSCWIYTFFTIHETKKKSGSWLNQVGKNTGRGITPNIVGKMKVTDIPFSELNREKLDSQYRIREFVLFATDSRHQPNDELAAIVLKVPNCHQDRDCSNISALGLTNPFEDLSMTAILPGGAHSLPSKGEPSSLIERWKTGGLCDCGGWDLGCKIRLLINRTNPPTISSYPKPKLTAEKYELLSEDNKPVLSLSTFKDGIYSVEFSSSLKVLQAFSICIAVLNGRNQEILHMQT